jgi:FtsH-binding integral membrane protein
MKDRALPSPAISGRRVLAIAVVLLATAVFAVGLAFFLSRQAWPALPGVDYIESGARARVVMWALWIAGIALGMGVAVALSRPGRAIPPLLVLIGAAAWTGLVAWALSIEATIYPVAPDAAAAAAPYAATSRAILIGGWLAGLLLASWLVLKRRRLDALPGH